MPRTRSNHARAGRRRDKSHELQPEQLPAARRLNAEALSRPLEVVGAAFRERKRRIRHAPQLEALLRACGGEGALEVGPRRLGVIALGGTRTENRLRRRLEPRLRLELLVGAGLELLPRPAGCAAPSAPFAAAWPSPRGV